MAGTTSPHIGTLIVRRYGRRTVLASLLAAPLATAPGRAGAQPAPVSSLTFPAMRHTLDATHHVADGYAVQVVLRWGDPVLEEAPAFDPANLTAAAQALQCGYNCDYVNFRPLPRGTGASDRGVLVVNHEYTNTGLMFAGIGSARNAAVQSTLAQAEVEMAAHGVSVVELRRDDGIWCTIPGGALNRRITASTPMTLSGPAAGHALMRTAADPDGRTVLGTIANCAGGDTPWGTVLTAEENFNLYFGGDPSGLPHAPMYRLYGLSRNTLYSWSRHFPRFNMEQEPNEPHRFGWIVEFDPLDPAATPVKRSALGRFKHECCTQALAPDGRVAFYMGDDERFQFVYKFVTTRAWRPGNPAGNRDLLDEGVLYAARFLEDGTLRWLPLVHGQGRLTAENGFASQAEVLIFARRAAALLGATPMDRPEDVETNPVTGRVYVMLTNNTARKPDQVDAANPRGPNPHGHILEIAHPDNDHAATQATWSLFIAAGRFGVDPGTAYNPATPADGWFSCPDNCAFDSQGRILITTDGAPETLQVADGLYMADTTGPGRALPRLLFQGPTGAEITGPCLTPDNRTLFLSVQHPGEDPGSTFETPSTRWPDFQPGTPPRPTVVAIVKSDGGVIGS
ncbi:MAG: PhoX family phosphatase [Acetobacteraceae bacterium]